jgi:hypothetical protein
MALFPRADFPPSPVGADDEGPEQSGPSPLFQQSIS